MEENYALKVKPRRFVYHVSRSSHRESILKKGLIGCPKKINGFRNAILPTTAQFQIIVGIRFVLM